MICRTDRAVCGKAKKRTDGRRTGKGRTSYNGHPDPLDVAGDDLWRSSRVMGEACGPDELTS